MRSIAFGCMRKSIDSDADTVNDQLATIQSVLKGNYGTSSSFVIMYWRKIGTLRLRMWKGVFGPTVELFSVHDNTTINGIRLPNFAAMYNMVVWSIKFQDRDSWSTQGQPDWEHCNRRKTRCQRTRLSMILESDADDNQQWLREYSLAKTNRAAGHDDLPADLFMAGGDRLHASAYLHNIHRERHTYWLEPQYCLYC